VGPPRKLRAAVHLRRFFSFPQLCFQFICLFALPPQLQQPEAPWPLKPAIQYVQIFTLSHHLHLKMPDESLSVRPCILNQASCRSPLCIRLCAEMINFLLRCPRLCAIPVNHFLFGKSGSRGCSHSMLERVFYGMEPLLHSFFFAGQPLCPLLLHTLMIQCRFRGVFLQMVVQFGSLLGKCVFYSRLMLQLQL
jgi:hypothetical protein